MIQVTIRERPGRAQMPLFPIQCVMNLALS
jgi:hypothetical protein